MNRHAKNLLATLVLFAGLCSPGASRADTYVVAAPSTVTYYVHHPLHEVEGQSANIRGEIELFADNLTDFSGLSKKIVQADWQDFASENSSRDANVRKFVQASKFPTITYVVKALQLVSQSNERIQVNLKGKLYVNGNKKTVISSGYFDIRDPKAIKFYTHIKTKLTDFGIEPPSLLFVKTKDPMEIDVALTLTPKG